MAPFSQILLTADYDRTLTAPDSTIPRRNLEAIRWFIQNGGAFTVNTGRSLPMSLPYLETVPVNAPLLLYNGSAAYDIARGELEFCHEIRLDPAQTLQTCMELFPDATVELQGVKAHYCFAENPSWAAYCRNNGCAWAFARPEDDLGPFLKFSLYGRFQDATVNSLFSGTPEECRRFDQIEAQLNARFGQSCTVFRPAARIIDVHAKGVSKARCARELQHRLGRKILVCVGDAENDLPMLQEADYAFVPADGAVAGWFETVCPCAQGSLAQVIYEKIPEILKLSLDNLQDPC